MADLYKDGTYIKNNPTWHAQDSAWKAANIAALFERNSLQPKTLCEVGCGAGGILRDLSERYPTAKVSGYEISPQAFEICSQIKKDNLDFFLTDLLNEEQFFDVAMAIDVFEHVEDYYGFLKKLKLRAEYKVFHIPLDLSILSVLRLKPILRMRESVGHIHYFLKDTALATLNDTGYEIVDYGYTSGSLELPRGWKSRLLRIPKKLVYAINKDLAVRSFGGFSLLVLAK